MSYTVVIDTEHCTGCGICARLCPSDCLVSGEGGIRLSGRQCIGCEHCAAACPVGAITVLSPDAAMFRYESFAWPPDPVAPAAITPACLASFLRRRRSCRHFSNRPVPEEMLRDLVRMAITAPSGTNSQGWVFCNLVSRAEVIRLGQGVAGFYRRLNRLAKISAARLYSRLFHGDALGRYWRRYYASVAASLGQWDRDGRDRLFHGAPAVIVIGGRKSASCAREDSLLACQNILLGAETMGLGSCMIGYAVSALQRDRALRRDLAFADDEEVHAVVALGFPAVSFLRPCSRKKPVVRRPVFSGVQGEEKVLNSR